MTKLRRSVAFGTVGIATLQLCAGAAYAQVARSGGGANAQLAQQYQQAVSDRDRLQADNDGLKKQLQDAKAQLDSSARQLATLKSSAGATASQLAAAQAYRQSSTQTITQYNNRLQDLISHYRDVVASLRTVEAQRTQLQQQIAQNKSALDRCAQINDQLYQVDEDVLARYEHQGFLSYMGRAEPFTRLKRTQIENLVDGYRQRAAELRVQGASQASAGSVDAAANDAPKSAAPAAK
jgi:chromosome segregation ATPase